MTCAHCIENQAAFEAERLRYAQATDEISELKDKLAEREATIVEQDKKAGRLRALLLMNDVDPDMPIPPFPVHVARRQLQDAEATIARLRGALEARGRRGHDWYCETRAHERMCREARERDAAQRAGGLYDGVNVPPYPCEHAIACDCGQDALTDALATPDPGRRWLEAHEAQVDNLQLEIAYTRKLLAWLFPAAMENSAFRLCEAPGHQATITAVEEIMEDMASTPAADHWLEAVEQAAKTLRYIESTVLPAFALYAKDDEPMGTNLRNITETVRANIAALEALR